jgi:hypothetical protein
MQTVFWSQNPKGICQFCDFGEIKKIEMDFKEAKC